MDILFKMILSVFESVLLILFLNTLLIQNIEHKKMRRFLFACYFIFQCLTYFLDSAFFSTSLYYILFTLFIAWIGYIDDIRIKLMTSGMFVMLNYACKLLSLTTFTNYFNQVLPSNPFDYVLTNQMQAVACVLLLFVLIIIFWMRQIRNEYTQVIINIIIFLLPLANLFISMLLLGRKGNIYNEITILLFSYTFLLFFLIDQIIYSSNTKQISDAMEQRLQSQQVYYQDIQEYSNTMSRFRHDVKNHYGNISYLLANHQIEEAQKYLEEYAQQIIHIKPVVNTGNNVVDVILNSKMKIIQDQQIDFHYDVVIPPVLKISAVDISVILGNLLDNAIEATSKLNDHKKIDVKIQIYKDNIFIHVSNIYNGKIITANHGFISTKENRRDHGLGLGNVSHIVKKNKGTIDINYDNNTFTVSILIPIHP